VRENGLIQRVQGLNERVGGFPHWGEGFPCSFGALPQWGEACTHSYGARTERGKACTCSFGAPPQQGKGRTRSFGTFPHSFERFPHWGEALARSGRRRYSERVRPPFKGEWRRRMSGRATWMRGRTADALRPLGPSSPLRRRPTGFPVGRLYIGGSRRTGGVTTNVPVETLPARYDTLSSITGTAGRLGGGERRPNNERPGTGRQRRRRFAAFGQRAEMGVTSAGWGDRTGFSAPETSRRPRGVWGGGVAGLGTSLRVRW
jgi:hypothetical protein